jgi:CHASE2 domain-containing sensor protein
MLIYHHIISQAISCQYDYIWLWTDRWRVAFRSLRTSNGASISYFHRQFPLDWLIGAAGMFDISWGTFSSIWYGSSTALGRDTGLDIDAITPTFHCQMCH